MQMNRRGFLGAMGAACAVGAMPAIAKSASGGFVIENRDIVLQRTLDLSGIDGFIIRNCRIRAAPGFEGNALISCGDSSRGLIQNCHLDTYNV